MNQKLQRMCVCVSVCVRVATRSRGHKDDFQHPTGQGIKCKDQDADKKHQVQAPGCRQETLCAGAYRERTMKERLVRACGLAMCIVLALVLAVANDALVVGVACRAR